MPTLYILHLPTSKPPQDCSHVGNLRVAIGDLHHGNHTFGGALLKNTVTAPSDFNPKYNDHQIVAIELEDFRGW